MTTTHPIIIPCPRCGREQDFSRLPAIVTDWQSLLAGLEQEPCESCVIEDITKNLRMFACTEEDVLV